LNLLKEGIKIVTLQDNREYDKDSIDKNPTELLISIVLMSAAHDESLKKSIRIREARKNKRDKLQKKEINIFSRKCPLWVKLSEDKTKFVPIQKASKAIKLIFKKRLEGKGSQRITTELNGDPSVWRPEPNKRNKKGGWQKSYINKILRNRNVIGEFQLHELKTIKVKANGEEYEKTQRVAVGDPIKNYYPKVIDDGLFFKVQEIIKQNSKKPGYGGGGGNKDKGSNLFSRIVYCGICGSKMQYLNKGKNNWQYLMCNSKRQKNKVPISIVYAQKHSDAKMATNFKHNKINESEDKEVEMVCPAKTVRYDEFERIIFENLNELDINDLLPNEDETTKIKKEKGNELAKNRHELEELKSQRDYLVKLLISNRDNETLERFDIENEKIKTKVAELEEENKNLIQDIEDLNKQRDNLQKQNESIKEFRLFLDSPKDEQERINRRFQLRQEIQNMIEWIEIYTLKDENEKYEEKEISIIKHKARKTIDNIKIKFKASKTFLKVIFVSDDGEHTISRGWPGAHNLQTPI
jgi:hypothetical protein